ANIEPMKADDDHGDRTLRFRPSRFRAFAGLSALALVLALEVARGHDATPTASAWPGEAGFEPAAVAVAPTLPPAPAGAPPRPPPSATPDAPSLDASATALPVAPARLLIDFEHGIEDGTLAVAVDGETRLRQPLRSRVTGRFLALEFRHGRVQRWLDV